MNPTEALRILEQATGAVTANRETHAKIIEALKVVEAALAPPAKPAESQKKAG